MTAELRKISYRVRSASKVNEVYAEALPARAALSPLGGYWNVEVGPLNSAVELFVYKDRAERDRVVAEAEKLPNWPPASEDILPGGETFLLEEAPFNPPFGPGSHGSIYEIRCYDYKREELPVLIEAWAELIDKRAAYSPFIGVFYTVEGPIARWFHIWAYGDTAERQSARAAAAKAGVWAPKTPFNPSAQENMLVAPAPFSPLH